MIYKKIYLITALFIAIGCFSQKQTAYVKQTQFGSDLQSLVVHSSNPIFTKFSLTKNGLELYRGSEFSLIKYDEIQKINTDDDSYRYEMEIDNMKIAVFFMPYYSNEPEMYMSIVSMRGLNPNNRNLLTFFKLVFMDELKK